MRKPVIIVCLLLLFGLDWLCAEPGAVTSANRVSFFFEPALGKGLGGTSYDLSFPWAPGVEGLSRLEFPQLQLEAGAVLGLVVDRGEKRSWIIEAGFFHSFLSMPGSMNDYDWIQQAGYPRVPFSYTYSYDSTVNWGLSVEAAWMFLHAGPLDLGLYGAYRYQNASHVEDGFTGWQWDPTAWNPAGTPTTVYVASSAQPDVLEYTLSAHMPGLGLLGAIRVFRGASLEARVAYTPVYVSDSDDHKLRTKLSTAAGWGNGLYADLRATWQFARRGGVAPYVMAYGQAIYWVVSTAQTQHWYGTGDPGVPAGTTITGVGHVITSAQFQVGIRMGFSL